jgi:hypothetical protein
MKRFIGLPMLLASSAIVIAVCLVSTARADHVVGGAVWWWTDTIHNNTVHMMVRNLWDDTVTSEARTMNIFWGDHSTLHLSQQWLLFVCE